MIVISVYVCQCQAGIYLGPYNMCQMLIFSTVVCPRCAPGIGGTTQFWGYVKKNFQRFAPEFVPPTSKPCRRLWVWLYRSHLTYVSSGVCLTVWILQEKRDSSHLCDWLQWLYRLRDRYERKLYTPARETVRHLQCQSVGCTQFVERTNYRQSHVHVTQRCSLVYCRWPLPTFQREAVGAGRPSDSQQQTLYLAV